MSHGDGQSKFIGKFLQFIFPCPQAIAICAATIGLNEQMLFSGKLLLPDAKPPAPKTSYSKFGRLVRGPDHHKTFVVRCIVNAIRNGHTVRIAWIIAFQNVQRFPTIRAAWIFKVPNQFTLFGIH
jgi:hypothetical protein